MTRLRPVRDDERDLLAAWRAEVSSPYDDFSGALPEGVTEVPASPPPGHGELLVTDDDDAPIGSVSWHLVEYGPGAASQALNVGISLRPEFRGQGHGARAQRLLADYLFVTTATHRVEASTDVSNLVEQRALERAGFRREGVARGAQWRQEAYHDMVVYSRLRTDG